MFPSILSLLLNNKGLRKGWVCSLLAMELVGPPRKWVYFPAQGPVCDIRSCRYRGQFIHSLPLLWPGLQQAIDLYNYGFPIWVWWREDSKVIENECQRWFWWGGAMEYKLSKDGSQDVKEKRWQEQWHGGEVPAELRVMEAKLLGGGC